MTWWLYQGYKMCLANIILPIHKFYQETFTPTLTTFSRFCVKCYSCNVIDLVNWVSSLLAQLVRASASGLCHKRNVTSLSPNRTQQFLSAQNILGVSHHIHIELKFSPNLSLSHSILIMITNKTILYFLGWI